MKKNHISIISIAAFASIVSCYAQNANAALLGPGTTISDLIVSVMNILRSLIPLLISAAIIVFLYGVLRFIVKSSAGNAEGRKEGINFMIFGIIGIAVMVSVWGLVRFVTSTFGVANVIPQFNSNLSR